MGSINSFREKEPCTFFLKWYATVSFMLSCDVWSKFSSSNWVKPEQRKSSVFHIHHHHDGSMQCPQVQQVEHMDEKPNATTQQTGACLTHQHQHTVERGNYHNCNIESIFYVACNCFSTTMHTAQHSSSSSSSSISSRSMFNPNSCDVEARSRNKKPSTHIKIEHLKHRQWWSKRDNQRDRAQLSSLPRVALPRQMHQARSIATRLRSNHSGINLSIRPGRFSSGKSQLVPILFRNLHIKSSPHTQSSIAALGARRCCRLRCSSVFFVLNFPTKKNSNHPNWSTRNPDVPPGLHPNTTRTPRRFPLRPGSDREKQNGACTMRNTIPSVLPLQKREMHTFVCWAMIIHRRTEK